MMSFLVRPWAVRGHSRGSAGASACGRSRCGRSPRWLDGDRHERADADASPRSMPESDMRRRASRRPPRNAPASGCHPRRSSSRQRSPHRCQTLHGVSVGCVRDRVEDVVVCPDFRCQGEPTPSERPERVLRRGRGVEDAGRVIRGVRQTLRLDVRHCGLLLSRAILICAPSLRRRPVFGMAVARQLRIDRIGRCGVTFGRNG